MNTEFNSHYCNPEELRIWAKVENQWETTVVEDTTFKRKEIHDGRTRTLVCHIIRSTKISRITKEKKYFFEITGWQPFPIWGEFETSYGILATWLRENGWERTFTIRTVYEKEVKEPWE